MFDVIGKLISGLIILACIAVPLAIWKLVDIAIWIYQHVSVHVGFGP